MRVASTGLGQTELIADIRSMKPQGELLGLFAEATSPADWHLETYLDPKDVRPVVFGFLRPSILWAVVSCFILFWRKGREPAEL